ncbi:SdrD B-like domain-containing protein [Actinokineospora auranticolor]|nr:SdrD B-like domain-containing protein [Actinokineospora auranticolor]
MSKSRAARRALAATLAALAAAAGVVVVSTTPAEASTARPFIAQYDEEIYGDFVQAGNGNMRCPDVTDPIDPFGEPRTTCPTARSRATTAATANNDSYYMRWADVDGEPGTINSSKSSFTFPPGAKVAYAGLSWAGNNGRVRLLDGTMATAPGCSTSQYLADAGNANAPAGDPTSQQVWFTVGGSTTTYFPQVINADSDSDLGDTQVGFYSAHVDVTNQVAQNVTTGTVNTGVGNIWTPEGFGCFAGWSLTVVYAYDEPTATYAEQKKHVTVFDGHAHQTASDSPTTITANGFRASGGDTRVGVTAYEGDFNINGDTFKVNGSAFDDPLALGTLDNFFVSNAPDAVDPDVDNNMSVDSKTLTTSEIAPGDTTATFAAATTNDAFLFQGLAVSVPVTSLFVTKKLNPGNPGPFRANAAITYDIVVKAIGDTVENVTINDPNGPACNKTTPTNVTTVAPWTYSCTDTTKTTSYTNTITASGLTTNGDEVVGQGKLDVVVINPSIDIAKTTDKANYALGETITFTIAVHNDGNAALTGVQVTDTTVPACNNATIGNLGVGANTSYTCTATAPITGDSNTASVTATDPLGGTVTDSSTVSVPTVGTISGKVFADRNNNGIYEPANSETTIAGVTVNLSGTPISGGPVSIGGTTNSLGEFEFPNMQGGTYTLTETTPAAFDDGIDTPGANSSAGGNDSFTIVISSGQSSTLNYFAEQPAASLAGYVYTDANNNGVKDIGEAGIANAVVQLTGTDSESHPITLPTSTNAGGAYSFPALRQGTYTITETTPPGLTDGKDTVGDATGTLQDPDSIINIGLGARVAGTGYLFGEFTPVSISGRVHHDGNPPNNGIQGVQLTLALPGGGTTQTNTLSDGSYSFTNLAPGTYSVAELQPAGYADGPESAGSPAGNTSVNDVISGITLASGQAGSEYDFAEDRGSLVGVVFHDRNNNGTKDSGEEGLSTTVTLTGNTPGGPVNTSVTSASLTGAFEFQGLLGGLYTLTETQVPGYSSGINTAGTANGIAVGGDAILGITLNNGQDATGYTFGEFTGGSITGRVVHDGAGPNNGISGVSIALSGAATDSTTTASDGTFIFENLAPGTYTITETQPIGYGDGEDSGPTGTGTGSVGNDVITGIVVASGQTRSEYEFAEERASISSVVYEDLNDNGIKDSGEDGVAGVDVKLTGTDANSAPVDITVTTNSDGVAKFVDLISGEYALEELDQPAPWLDGDDTAGTAGGTPVPNGDKINGIALTPGQIATGYRFGEIPGAAISGSVVDDNTTGPKGIQSVLITLSGTDDRNQAVNDTGYTDEDGVFAFTDLRPGTYKIVETQPTEYGDGPDIPGTIITNTPVPTNDEFNTIILGAGDKAVDYKFTETLGSLAGVVFRDKNNNNVQDPGEAGIPGVTINLTRLGLGRAAAAPEPAGSVVTGPNGAYVFENLVGNAYAITEVQPANFGNGQIGLGNPAGTLQPPNTITGILLEGGQDGTGYTFGELAQTVTGTVWRDDNGNGQIDVDETVRYEGVTVELFDLDGNLVDTAVTAAVTGMYSFGYVPAGSYTIKETQPAGVGSTTPDAIQISVTTETGASQNFGEQLGLIGDYVWNDSNANGVQDAGEPAAANIAVTLYQADGTTVVKSTTTGSDGKYWFRNLAVGDYKVGIELPTGKVLTRPHAGTNGDLDSDIDWVTGRTATLGIAVVDNLIPQLTNVDAGLVNKLVDLAAAVTTASPTAAIGDTVVFNSTITNAGTVPVRGARVVITIPAGLRIVSAGGDAIAAQAAQEGGFGADAFEATAAVPWTCTISGQQVTCVTDATILPGQTTGPVLVNTTALTTITDTTATAAVTLADGTPDDNAANDNAVAAIAVPASTTTTSPSTSTDDGTLASTGANVRWLFLGGVLLVAIGCAALFIVRRRRGSGTE